MDREKELHRIVPSCVIHKDGRFLLIQRAPHKMPNPSKWALPGGGLSTDDYVGRPHDHGEAWKDSLEIALARELQQEVGVEVAQPRYLMSYTFIRPDGIPVLGTSFHAAYVSGDVMLDNESVDSGWFTLDEAREIDLIPGIIERLERVDALLSNMS